MDIELKEREKLRGQLLHHEPLAGYTSWRVGGPARQLYKPADIDDLALFLKSISPKEPIYWLGLGSNALIRDGGIAGTVIITQGALKGIALLKDHQIRVEAGVSCATMARFAARNDLAEAEFWAGIPGTMGGALRMNAGCYQGETWMNVVEVETMTRYGEIRKRTPQEFSIAYRHVEGLEDDEWFIAATFALPSGNKEASLQSIKTLLERRAATQPTSEYNCGSVFRNPEGHYAAQLIELCQLKGFQMGGAMVSTKHANFIINHEAKASAHDIESLIEYVRQTVLTQTNFDLIREVHIIGESLCPND